MVLISRSACNWPSDLGFVCVYSQCPLKEPADACHSTNVVQTLVWRMDAGARHVEVTSFNVQGNVVPDEADVLRVVVIRKGKCVKTVQPAVIGMAPFVRFPNFDHGILV